ncbi:MAG: HAMP domain-containing protein [Lentisphaeria bacterium]|nr:HAMP domain-containing protein [Lentisphaeria bacterium]
MRASTSDGPCLSTRLFLAHGLVVVVGFALVGVLAYLVVRSGYVSRATRTLETAVKKSSEALRQAAEEGNRLGLDQICEHLNRPFQGRVSVIDAGGRVMADSMSLRCHARARPECVPGIRARQEKLLRNYAPLNDTVTVRLPVRLGTAGPATVRLALPIHPVRTQTRRMGGVLVLGAVSALVLAVCVTAWLSRRIARPVERMTALAERIADGNFSAADVAGGPGEVGRLGEALNSMRGALQGNVAALKHERNQALAIVQTMADGVLALDGDQRILLANRAASALLDESVLEPGTCLTADTLPTRCAPSLIAALEVDQPQDLEVGDFTRGERVLHVSVRPVGQGEGTVLALRDITEAKRAETLGRELVANASHELRTPIAIIRSTADTMLDLAETLPPEQREFTDIIGRQAARMEALVNETLSLSRLEADMDGGGWERLCANEIAEQVVSMHSPLASKREIELRFLPCADSAVVIGDAAQLREAVANLVENALHYTPVRGRVAVAVESGEDEVRILVSDTGPGVAPSERDRIFRRFVRGPAAATRGEGSGLGLAIVARIAELHGGHVDVQSAPGGGSVFRLLLPATPAV